MLESSPCLALKVSGERSKASGLILLLTISSLVALVLGLRSVYLALKVSASEEYSWVSL